jgi:hypothetical protein
MAATVPVPHGSPLIGRKAERAIVRAASPCQVIRQLTLPGPVGVKKAFRAPELPVEPAPGGADAVATVAEAGIRLEGLPLVIEHAALPLQVPSLCDATVAKEVLRHVRALGDR